MKRAPLRSRVRLALVAVGLGAIVLAAPGCGGDAPPLAQPHPRRASATPTGHRAAFPHPAIRRTCSSVWTRCAPTPWRPGRRAPR
jgi:hypothetical protein